MRQRVAIAFFVTTMMLAIVGPAPAADLELVDALRKLGAAVDNMSAHISNAQSDADAELLIRVTRQAFESQLKDYHPTIEMTGKAGYCKVSISTPAWQIWSEARGGKVVDHGGKIL